ncbi:hypothetical protein RGUI_0469 [Rhodovulum sp. P5]|nr:hypothetical protein RGUI_0469 [Rhodovulum sp. P5]
MWYFRYVWICRANLCAHVAFFPPGCRKRSALRARSEEAL